MNSITLEPIGYIYTPFKEPKGTPIQPRRSDGALGRVELLPEYEPALSDLAGFSHIMLIYYFHLSPKFRLKVIPFLDNQERGLFATRAPRRPNPIGLSVVKLQRVEGKTLFVKDVDIVDGTPLLDIKPYIPHFDNLDSVRLGWLDNISQKSDETTADDRFED